jgi:hypothetical protein
MGGPDNRADVDQLKEILRTAWKRIVGKSAGERAYAFGLYTNDAAQYMYPFLLGEKGLEKIAKEYVTRGSYTAADAARNLRWSTADSAYELSEQTYEFDDRPDVYDLSDTAAARETHYRLNAAATALKELDKEGVFGRGEDRQNITLYIEGGDVNREWILKWAKKVNPRPVYDRFAKIGTPDDIVGTFTEFGTKKVYETKEYAQSADKKLIAAATAYHLFIFDTTGPKQLFGKGLPTGRDSTALGGVGMSGDGKLIAVIPFGSGKDANSLFILSGKNWADLKTVKLKESPNAVRVSPAGDWIAVTDDAGALNIYEPTGELRASRPGHKDWPRGLAVSPDGTRVATADGQTVVLWETSKWTKLWTIKREIDSLDFDSTGKLIAGACYYARKEPEPRTASIIDAKSGKVLREVKVDGFRIQHVRFSPDGNHLACAMRIDSEDHCCTDKSALVEIKTSKVLDELRSDFEQVRDFAFLPHRGEIAVAVFGHTRRPLVLWKVAGAHL